MTLAMRLSKGKGINGIFGTSQLTSFKTVRVGLNLG